MAGLAIHLRKGLMQSKSTNLMISKIRLDKSLKKSSADLFYKYLEKRSYIQGVVVLDGMLKCCAALLPELQKKTYKILEAKILSEINFGTTAVAYIQNKKLQVKKNQLLLSKSNISQKF